MFETRTGGGNVTMVVGHGSSLSRTTREEERGNRCSNPHGRMSLNARLSRVVATVIHRQSQKKKD